MSEGFLVPLRVDPLELLVVLLHQAVESGLPWIAGTVDNSRALFHTRGKGTNGATDRTSACNRTQSGTVGGLSHTRLSPVHLH